MSPLRANLPVLLALALVLAACQAPSLAGPFVYDDGAVSDNPRLKDPRALLLGFFRPPAPATPGMASPWYPYRPLAELSFGLNLAVSGPSPESLRTGNVLIHAAAAVLVLLLARRLLKRGAPWAALLFAVHPLGVQAVSYLYQRATALEAALYLLCLLAYLGRRTRLALAAGLLAGTAKESAAAIPLSLLALEWILRDPAEPLSRVLKRWLPFLGIPLLVAAAVLLSGRGAGGQQAPFEYLLLQVQVLWRYLGMAAWPFPLRFYHEAPDGSAALCASGLVALLAWILIGPRRHAPARLALALFLAPLAAESSLFPIQGIAWSYRTYPSLLGAGLLLALSVRGLRTLPASALLCFAALSAWEARLWTDPRALQRRDVVQAPRTIPTRATWAWWLLAQEDQAERAERLFRHALRGDARGDLKTREGHLYALLALGRVAEARAEAEDADRDFRGHQSILWRKVQAATQAGDAEGLNLLEPRVSAVPALRPELLRWLLQRQLSAGRWAEAEALVLKHLPLYPSDPFLRDYLGWIRLNTGRPAEAERDYREALALEPGLWKCHYHLAELLRLKGDLEGARAEYLRALEIRPDYAKARERLAALTRSWSPSPPP